MFLSLLAATLLTGLLTDPTPADEDPTAILTAMRETCGSARTLHCTMVLREEPQTGEPATLLAELWFDVAGRRIRAEFRDPVRPEPHLIFLNTTRGLLVYQADADQTAQDPGPRDWSRMLHETLVGELWLAAFTGQLASMRRQSYLAPRWLGEEDLDGNVCHLLSFEGNAETLLWVDREDHLPRKIVGPLPGMLREERVEFLEIDAPLDAERFHLTAPPGQRVLPLVLARQAWANLPAQKDLWPATGRPAPPCAAQDLAGKAVTWPEAAGPMVLAFWFSGSEEVVRRLVHMEQALEELPEPVPLVSVHHGNDAATIRSAMEVASLDHPVWVAGEGPENPFRVYRIASCPVFFLLDSDRTVLGASREVEDVLCLLMRRP